MTFDYLDDGLDVMHRFNYALFHSVSLNLSLIYISILKMFISFSNTQKKEKRKEKDEVIAIIKSPIIKS